MDFLPVLGADSRQKRQHNDKRTQCTRDGHSDSDMRGFAQLDALDGASMCAKPQAWQDYFATSRRCSSAFVNCTSRNSVGASFDFKSRRGMISCLRKCSNRSVSSCRPSLMRKPSFGTTPQSSSSLPLVVIFSRFLPLGRQKVAVVRFNNPFVGSNIEKVTTVPLPKVRSPTTVARLWS